MSDYPIDTGFWKDHTQGAPLGWTITLSAYDATFLISGLTVAITLAGGSAWSIATFFLHQYRTPIEDDRYGFARQKNVALRNSGTPASFAWELVKMGKGPEPVRRHSRSRTVALALWPIFIFAFFNVAGTLSALTANAGYEELRLRVRSTNCGFAKASDTTNSAAGFALLGKAANDTRNARTYSSVCYGTNHTSLSCAQYPKRALKISTKDGVECPFRGGSGRCSTGPLGAYSVQSDLIDSHEDLGINAPKADRVQMRKTLTCSVVHSSDDEVEIDGNHAFYFYGDAGAGAPFDKNATYVYNGLWVNNSIFGYTTLSVMAGPGFQEAVKPGSDLAWTPTPDFNNISADTSLHFLAANSLRYIAPNYDPWFSATKEDYSTGKLLFAPTHYVAIMGCTEQYEWRNPVTGDKTSPNGLLTRDYDDLGLNDQQLASAERIVLALQKATVYQTLVGQQGDALDANSLTQQLIGGNVDNSQWTREVTRWFETGLALLQGTIVDYPTNSWAASVDEPVVLAPRSLTDANQKAFEAQCKKQIVRNIGGYRNFSFLGVLIIAVVTALIIGTSLIPVKWVFKLPCYREGKKWHAKRIAWEADEKLALLQALRDYQEEHDGGRDGKRDDEGDGGGGVAGNWPLPAMQNDNRPSEDSLRPGHQPDDVELQPIDRTGSRSNLSRINTTFDDSLLYATHPAQRRHDATDRATRRGIHAYSRTPGASPGSSAAEFSREDSSTSLLRQPDGSS